jgi:hypothetical protein
MVRSNSGISLLLLPNRKSALLTVKVAGAEAAELYDLKMENAAIIRKAARDLLDHSTKTLMTTYLFMVLKKVPKNETQQLLMSNILIFQN